jgi:hypothetical protein
MKFNIDAFTNMNSNIEYLDFISNKISNDNFSRYTNSKPLENEDNKKIEEHIFFHNNYQHENVITPFLIFILAISIIFYYKKNY